MADIRPVVFILGFLLLALGAAMLPSALVDVVNGNPDVQVFLASSGAVCFAGGLCVAAARPQALRLRLREAFLLTNAAWIVLPLGAAVPFLAGVTELSLTDAVFEAVSGLTTTGSTVMNGLAQQPPGLLLWRSMLQWIGGVGIIVMGIAILPFLEVGGMQLFRLESSDRSEKILPRARRMIVAILGVYGLLTLTCMAAYTLLGMSGFDAVNHAMTTLSEISQIVYFRGLIQRDFGIPVASFFVGGLHVCRGIRPQLFETYMPCTFASELLRSAPPRVDNKT